MGVPLKKLVRISLAIAYHNIMDGEEAYGSESTLWIHTVQISATPEPQSTGLDHGPENIDTPQKY